jgi:hypothetical protein
MAAGGIRSLISGKSDFELVTEGSQFSYFLQEFKARPKFQCQMLPFPFEGTCHYGDTYTQTLPTAGDLLTRIYLKVTLPNISPSVYATSIGNYLFEYAELMINRQVIERYYGEFNQLVQEITVPQIKQPLLSKLSGKDVPDLTGPNTFYIEIPFSLCERGIPMLAVAPGSFEIRIKYRPSREFTFPSVNITDVVNGEFLMEYVYLGPDEAKYFEAKKRTYLVQQTQFYQGTIDTGQTTVSYPLHFIGPVKELFFYIKPQQVTKNVFTINTDYLINLQLMLDGYEVISQDIAVPLYLRGVQPMDFHTRIPTSTIFYIYSFCLDPENMEPTGQLNFGRIQQQILNMNLIQTPFSRYVRVYARSYNIFTTEKGIGKLLFNSNG